MFKMNTMGNDLYLKTAVLLPADVFEKFIEMCLEYYGLDPCPGSSWDAMLKKTRIKLGLISDIDMHLFVEKRIIGDIYYIAKKYSKANNKYMKFYKVSKQVNISCISTQIIYMVGK